MTFTLVARCPKTGQMGIGIATYSICVGLYCNGLRPNVGATMSQAFVNQGNNTLALRLLEQGFGPSRVLDELSANDPDFAYRQIAVIDRDGSQAIGVFFGSGVGMDAAGYRTSEALHAAQQDAHRHLVPPVQVEQRIGGKAARGPLPLPEVAGQLQAVLVHSCIPISRPSAAAATPRTRLTATLATAAPCLRSSAIRCVSSIQVENVVYEPTAAVPASSACSLLSASPVSRPRMIAPERLTTRVPNGKSRPAVEATTPSTRNRATEPAPPISTTPTKTRTLTEGLRLRPRPSGRR